MPDAERFAEWLERLRQIHADATAKLCRHGPNCRDCKTKPTEEDA